MKRVGVVLLAIATAAGAAGCDVSAGDARDCIAHYCGLLCEKVVSCGATPAAEIDACTSICMAGATGKSEESCQQDFTQALKGSCDDAAEFLGLRSALLPAGKGIFLRP